MSRSLTVVMPNYNHAAYLPGAIEEIVNQTRPPDEFLILDDCSTDNSREIIENYARRFPIIRFLSNARNSGVIAAHTRLFEEARGEYIYCAAADDVRFPTFFERAMEMAERYPDAGIIFGKMVRLGPHDEPEDEFGVDRWSEPLFASPARCLSEYFDVAEPTHSLSGATIYRREAFQEVGWYRPELEFWADTFALRAVALKYGACYVPEVFHGWRQLPASYSRSHAGPERPLRVVKRAARLMRSPEFRDRFPLAHVSRWQRRYVRTLIRDYWWGDTNSSPGRPSFFVRNLTRLSRTPQSISYAVRYWR